MALLIPDRIRRLLVLLGAGAVTAGIGSYASAEPYNPGGLDHNQLSEVGDVCQSVLRVRPGEEHYVSCVESLSGAVRNLGQGQSLSRARDMCLQRGLAPDTPELAECTLRTSQAVGDAGPRYQQRHVWGAEPPGATKSYFSASPQEVYRREQLSCAHLGLDPASGGFNSCVADLQASLFAADNPM